MPQLQLVSPNPGPVATIRNAAAELFLHDGDFIQAAFYYRQTYPELAPVWDVLEQLERDHRDGRQYFE